MANFISSQLVAAQSKLIADFTKPEMREMVLPAMSIGLANQGVLVQNVNDLRKREDRAVYGYALSRQVRDASGGTRSYNHTGSRGDSMQLPFTWNTFLDKFSISLKQLDNNVFGYPEALTHLMRNSILNIHKAIEIAAIDYLQTNRTQVVQTTTPVGSRVTWNAANYVHEIAADDSKQFSQLMTAVLRANYYNDGMYDAIFNNGAYVNAQFWQSQGMGNAQNTAFQFGGADIRPSVILDDDNYSGAPIAIAMPKGSFAMIPWIPKQNREGHGDYNSTLGGYGSMVDPITNPGGIYAGGLVFAIHAYTERADTSSYNGVEQDDVLQVEISVDVANAQTPLSTSNETTSYEFVQM